MKTKKSILAIGIFSIFLLSQTLKANEKIINQKGPGIEISTMLTLNGKVVTAYTLIVCDEKLNSDTIHVHNQTAIFLKLGYDHNYTFHYLKNGIPEKMVMIDTRINEDKKKNQLGFDFKIEMNDENEKTETIQTSAVIRFNESKNQFDYSWKDELKMNGMEIELLQE